MSVYYMLSDVIGMLKIKGKVNQKYSKLYILDKWLS